jgi:hypothetical protein
MRDTRPVQRSMLPGPIDIHLVDGELDFRKARSVAEGKAFEVLDHPILLAWFDGETGMHSPAIC